MSGSQTKQMIIERHLANHWLQSLVLSPVQTSAQDLRVDQPTRQPHPLLIKKVVNALEHGETHYADVPGIMPLREKLAEHLKDIGLRGYEPTNVLVTAGVQECRFLAIQMIGELFGCIGLPTVVHPGVLQAASVRHIEVKRLPVDVANGLLPTLAGLREVLESGCKLLYLESPVRLTGAIYDEVTVAEIARVIDEFEAAVIWDQGLCPWVQSPRYASLAAQPGMAERVAVLGESWPGLGLESWFIGYLGAKADWLERMRSQKQIIAICTSTPSQYAALKAAELYPDEHNAQLEILAQYHNETLNLVSQLGVAPVSGSTVNLVALQMAQAEREGTVLRQAGFEVVDGAHFGAPGVLRLAVTPDNAATKALGYLITSARG